MSKLGLPKLPEPSKENKSEEERRGLTMGVVGPDKIHPSKSVWPLMEIFVTHGEEKQYSVVKTTKTVGEW